MSLHPVRLPSWQPARGPRHQRGVTMLFGLIALAVMMIGAAAMVRSMNTQFFNAGNLGFKRDLTNQGERAMVQIRAAVTGTGALVTETARQSHVSGSNYRATFLASNAQGIPNALLTNTAFTGIGVTTNDITVAGQEVTIRYVVDRLCHNTGPADPSHCVMVDLGVPQGTSSTEINNAIYNTSGGVGSMQQQVVYRLSVRVTGPRNTQAFFQSTFTL